MPRGPQPGAFFRGFGPLKGVAALVAGDFLHGLRLLFHAGGRAVEFHQQHGFFAQTQLGVGVHHAHGVFVDQLHTGDGHAQLDHLNGGAHSRLDAGEGADRGGHGFR